MEYYMISFVGTIVLFTLIQLFEYNKKRTEENENDYYEPYVLLSTKNYLLFAIIYLLLTIAAYFAYSSNFDLSSIYSFKKHGGSSEINSATQPTIKEEINPQVLSKINDNFDIGFDPFNSDASSISSLSGSDTP